MTATPEQIVLMTIEKICADDFCEDLDTRAAAGELPGDLAIAHRKLSAVYRLAHSHVESHSCHEVHGDWREELSRVELLQAGDL